MSDTKKETQQITQAAIARTATLPTLTVELSKTQHGWLKLEEIKRNTFSDLERQELAVQALLKDIVGDKELESVQAKIKEAKGIATTAKDQRLQFTNMITDKLITPSMDFEKRSAELIGVASSHELDLRKEAAKKAEAAGDYNKELASLKAHITNEYFRIAAAYRLKLDKLVTDAFITALQSKTPVADIPAYILKVKDFLAEEKLPPFVKFERRLVNDKDANTAFASIERYNPKVDLDNAIKELDAKFALYEEELQSAEAAIENATKLSEEKEAKAKDSLAVETATNVLIAQAETPVIAGPTVKKNLVLVEENTQTFAMAVLAHFIKNINEAAPKLRVKTWSKLSIGQMGDALAKVAQETGKQFTGLVFKEEEK